MYIYFDESFLYINGVKYVFIGCIAYKTECTKNTIQNNLKNFSAKFKHKAEVKYTGIKNVNLKNKILTNIKSECLFYTIKFRAVSHTSTIHEIINDLIESCLQEFKDKYKINHLNLIYDRSTYILDEKRLKNNFNFIKTIRKRDSKIFAGLQHADWIVGEARVEYANKNTVR